ncbi:MAG: ATP-dependent DNA ligase [Acidobacteria bacterium]|nr:MAG: ATP-dependent DNA ligase [Acidobacteriota bacterium]REJ98217.1 MAG: ATP-dependent DNA ligase [Acidobacteriota bacterium]REK16961.1 MAG: ATP-dependent DNA ligase [Acidobacteriota bacterium]REK42871.1 MAG: ATP-dependent DNA ligase [Acidobacteriota bacterium]
MNLFTNLYLSLDQTNKTNEKVAAMRDYFRKARPEDAAWALYFLSGNKPRQIVPSRRLRELATELAGIPDWMYEECRNTVGDSAETISLLLSEGGNKNDLPFNELVRDHLLPLRGADEEVQKAVIGKFWTDLDRAGIFVLNKLISGAFRVGVSQKLVMRAIAEEFGLPVDIVALRMMGNWEPTAEFFRTLTDANLEDEAPIARPYPFHLAYPIEDDLSKLGSLKDWQIEWKYDGIRCQVIKREGEVFLWSRGEDLINDSFPEIVAAAEELPDGTVLDGEILPFRHGRILQFQDLQKRLNRKKLTDKLLAKIPVILQTYDILESGTEDIRQKPLASRREVLEEIAGVEGTIRITEPLRSASWEKLDELRDESRSHGVEGFMLKRFDSPYRVGRQRGDWWKWKIDPFTVDAVLIYAQKGSGRRANLFTDYTFAVWNDDKLVTFAKAYSGLTDEEIRRVDRFVRDNTRETFGPVRSVEPVQVFEIAFEGIQRSKRHKSGVAVRFPRIHRWREDKKPEEADSIETIHALLEEYEPEANR